MSCWLLVSARLFIDICARNLRAPAGTAVAGCRGEPYALHFEGLQLASWLAVDKAERPAP